MLLVLGHARTLLPCPSDSEFRITCDSEFRITCPSDGILGTHGVEACCASRCGECGGRGCRDRGEGCCARDAHVCCAVNPTMPCLAFRRHRKCEAIEFLQAENGLPVVVAEPVVAESVVAETGVAD